MSHSITHSCTQDGFCLRKVRYVWLGIEPSTFMSPAEQISVLYRSWIYGTLLKQSLFPFRLFSWSGLSATCLASSVRAGALTPAFICARPWQRRPAAKRLHGCVDRAFHPLVTRKKKKICDWARMLLRALGGCELCFGRRFPEKRAQRGLCRTAVSDGPQNQNQWCSQPQRSHPPGQMLHTKITVV